MTTGFHQQAPNINFSVPRSAPKPQHGRAPDQKVVKVKEQKSIHPRPGH